MFYYYNFSVKKCKHYVLKKFGLKSKKKCVKILALKFKTSVLKICSVKKFNNRC